jgi:hypothetical protein
MSLSLWAGILLVVVWWAVESQRTGRTRRLAAILVLIGVSAALQWFPTQHWISRQNTRSVALEAVREALIHPQSARFGEISVRPGGAGGAVVCGRLGALGAEGAFVGANYFAAHVLPTLEVSAITIDQSCGQGVAESERTCASIVKGDGADGEGSARGACGVL